MLRLHDYEDSGNGYKVRLLAAFLEIPLEIVPVDILAGASRTPEFLAKNPSGQVPVLELDDGRFLSESNAILLYLGERTPFVPEDAFERARMFAWLFFEQYSHEPYVATPRFLVRHTPDDHPRRAELPERRARGRRALAVLDDALARSPFLIGDAPTLADVALYAYTHVAPEGGIELAPFPAVLAWIERIARLPGHVKLSA